MINCPWCHNPFEPSASGRCPHCGTIPPSGERGQAAPAEPQSPTEADAEPGFNRGTARSIFDVLLGPEGGGLPWERRGEAGFWNGLWSTVRGILFSPLRSFRAMRRSGGYWESFSFALLMGAAAFGFAATLIGLSRHLTLPGIADPWWAVLPQEAGARILAVVAAAVVLAALMPVLAALGAHACLRLFGVAGAGFEPTFRVFCYAIGGTSLLTALPLCGSVLFIVWYLIVATIGVVLVHRTSIPQAFGAVAVPPAAVLLVLGIVMSILGASALASGGG
jgi:hypothetical protein